MINLQTSCVLYLQQPPSRHGITTTYPETVPCCNFYSHFTENHEYSCHVPKPRAFKCEDDRPEGGGIALHLGTGLVHTEPMVQPDCYGRVWGRMDCVELVYHASINEQPEGTTLQAWFRRPISNSNSLHAQVHQCPTHLVHM